MAASPADSHRVYRKSLWSYSHRSKLEAKHALSSTDRRRSDTARGSHPPNEAARGGKTSHKPAWKPPWTGSPRISANMENVYLQTGDNIWSVAPPNSHQPLGFLLLRTSALSGLNYFGAVPGWVTAILTTL